jgi:hypothetical protein
MANIYHIHLHTAADIGEMRALAAVATALEHKQQAQNQIADAIKWGVSLAALGAAFGFFATTPLIIPAIASFGITYLLGIAYETFPKKNGVSCGANSRERGRLNNSCDKPNNPLDNTTKPASFSIANMRHPPHFLKEDSDETYNK